MRKTSSAKLCPESNNSPRLLRVLAVNAVMLVMGLVVDCMGGSPWPPRVTQQQTFVAKQTFVDKQTFVNREQSIVDGASIRWNVPSSYNTPSSHRGGATEGHPHNVAKRNISGMWQLNRNLSANGRSELPGQLEADGLALPVTATMIWTRAEDDPRTTEILEATELLEIFQQGKELTMNATGGSDVVLTRTIYTDGRPSEQRFGSGFNGISRARREGEILVIETETLTGPRLTETYQLSEGGELLYVTVTIENRNWSEPLVIQRVYDRIS